MRVEIAAGGAQHNTNAHGAGGKQSRGQGGHQQQQQQQQQATQLLYAISASKTVNLDVNLHVSNFSIFFFESITNSGTL